MDQHFAPRFYLKAFACDPLERGHIWVYRKGEAPERRSINRTAMEEDLYAFTRDDGSRDCETVEDLLMRVDSDGALACREVIGRRPLTGEGRRQLSAFVSRMLRGTPVHREGVNRTAAATMSGFFDKHDEAWLHGFMLEKFGIGPEADRTFALHREALARVRSKYLTQVPDHLFPHEVVRPSVIEEVLVEMDWAFFVARPGMSFITCDNPVAYSRGSGLGDKDRGLVIFPISPELCLQAMWCTSFQGRYAMPSSADIRQINRYIIQNASTEIYSHVNSTRLASFVGKWSSTELGIQRAD